MQGLITLVILNGPNHLGWSLAFGCERQRFVPSNQTSCPSVKGWKLRCPFFRSVYFFVIVCARHIEVCARSRSVFRWAMRCSISGI
jgi:hypothetical protein